MNVIKWDESMMKRCLMVYGGHVSGNAVKEASQTEKNIKPSINGKVKQKGNDIKTAEKIKQEIKVDKTLKVNKGNIAPMDKKAKKQEAPKAEKKKPVVTDTKRPGVSMKNDPFYYMGNMVEVDKIWDDDFPGSDMDSGDADLDNEAGEGQMVVCDVIL